MARPTPAIAATGSTAPENRTAGKQSSGSANVAWDGSVTAAEASRPRVKATTASTSSATVSATYSFTSPSGRRPVARRTTSIATFTPSSTGTSTVTLASR